jgi:hypothetical protein
MTPQRMPNHHRSQTMGRSPQTVSFRFSSKFPLSRFESGLFSAKVVRHVGTVLLLICVSVCLCSADVVGTLNVHTSPDEHRTTGWDSGQPVAVQVDFSRTQDGTYDVTVWSGERQFEKVTRVDIQARKATQRGESNGTGPITVYCPRTDLQQNGPTSFQVFVQAVLDDNGQKGGRVLIAEVDWQLGSVEDSQPGKKIEPRQVICSAGSNLDCHATGSFLFKNQSDRPLRAYEASPWLL